MDYKGTSSVGTISSLGQSHTTSMRSTNQKSRTTIQTATASSSQWDNNVIERLRVIIATSTKSLREIFNEFDEDGNGFITQVEFRNAMRKLNLGITSREMDQVLQQIDNNGDGKIDWLEFSAKFKDNSFDARMASRAAIRMAKLKELMNLHMTSANDAFRYVSLSCLNWLLQIPFSFSLSYKFKQDATVTEFEFSKSSVIVFKRCIVSNSLFHYSNSSPFALLLDHCCVSHLL